MVIGHRQRVAATGQGRGVVPLEIHLPALVGKGLLETAGAVRFRHLAQATGSAQNIGDGAGRRRLGMTLAFEPPMDFAPAPGRVFISHGQHFLHPMRASQGRTTPRPAG